MIGQKFKTNEGYDIEIIEYFKYKNCTIKFDDGTLLYNISLSNIKAGTVKNPMHKSVFNIGYYGIGKYKARDFGKITKEYAAWRSMLERCYDPKCQSKQPTYIGCSVDEKWHNFQIFAKWFEDNYKPGYAIDKDICFKGNKLYSENTCNFVPREINNLFTKREKLRGKYPIGVYKFRNKFYSMLSKSDDQIFLGSFDNPKKAFDVYKKEKEIHIKEIANKYKNDIPLCIYESMNKYVVNEND